MNTIDTAQNTARSIDLHAAKSHYYLGVAWVQRVQLVLLVLNAISWPILIYWKPDLKVYSALAAIVLPLLEILLLECIQKNWKSTAAKIQEAGVLPRRFRATEASWRVRSSRRGKPCEVA